MSRPRFSIRALLLLTALACFALTFAVQQGTLLTAVLVTVLLVNFTCTVVALAWYVVIPLFGKTK